MDNSRMLIIGFGCMGHRFAKIFCEYFDVYISSTRDVAVDIEAIGAKPVNDFEETVSSARYIFIAVPIHALDGVISKVNEHVNPSTWAFDMCSARIVAQEKMSALKCRWFGLHATGIFGEPSETILEVLARHGLRYQPMTAETHDKENSITAMAHFVGMGLDFLMDDYDRTRFQSSPAARNLMNLIEHLKNNSPDTYWESQICNPFTREQRRRLLNGLQELDCALARGEFPFSDRLSGVWKPRR